MCGPSTYWQNGSVLLLPHSWKMKKKQFHQNTVVLIKDTPIPTAGFHHKQDHSHSLVLISVTKASKPSSDMWNLSSNQSNLTKLSFCSPSPPQPMLRYSTTKSPENFFPCHQTYGSQNGDYEHCSLLGCDIVCENVALIYQEDPVASIIMAPWGWWQQGLLTDYRDSHHTKHCSRHTII